MARRKKQPDKEYRNRQKRKREAARKAWWEAYTAYLQSPEWAAKRAYILRRDKVCRVCGGPAEQVHHLTYVRVKPPNFSELMSDLIAVCVACHEEIHATP